MMLPLLDVPQTITSRAFYEARRRVIAGAVGRWAFMLHGWAHSWPFPARSSCPWSP